MNEDDPQDVAHEAFSEAVLGDHELGRPIGGNKETIGAVTRDAVWQHYKENYRPQDLVVAAAGGVKHSEFVELVEKELSAAGWDLGLAAAPVARRSNAQAIISRGKPLQVVKRPIAQANILLGMPGIIGNDARRYAMGILNTVLGGGMSSRLFQEIREKRGLAYSVYSFNQGYSDASTFGLYAGCSPAKAEQVTRLMLDEFEKIAQSSITTDELELAIGNISGGLALKFESSQARMSRLVGSEMSTGEFFDLDETIERFSSVTTEQVQSLVQDLLLGERTIVAVGDVEEKIFEPFL
jgi:predicted Zn-dependent peptidase